jgi:hypothetical protein
MIDFTGGTAAAATIPKRPQRTPRRNDWNFSIMVKTFHADR